MTREGLDLMSRLVVACLVRIWYGLVDMDESSHAEKRWDEYIKWMDGLEEVVSRWLVMIGIQSLPTVPMTHLYFISWVRVTCVHEHPAWLPSFRLCELMAMATILLIVMSINHNLIAVCLSLFCLFYLLSVLSTWLYQGGEDQQLPILVSRVAPNTPADTCVPKLNEGDQVLSVNGKDVIGLSHDDVVALIRSTKDVLPELVLLILPNGEFCWCFKTVYKFEDMCIVCMCLCCQLIGVLLVGFLGYVKTWHSWLESVV